MIYLKYSTIYILFPFVFGELIRLFGFNYEIRNIIIYGLIFLITQFRSLSIREVKKKNTMKMLKQDYIIYGLVILILCMYSIYYANIFRVIFSIFPSYYNYESSSFILLLVNIIKAITLIDCLESEKNLNIYVKAIMFGVIFDNGLKYIMFLIYIIINYIDFKDSSLYKKSFTVSFLIIRYLLLIISYSNFGELIYFLLFISILCALYINYRLITKYITNDKILEILRLILSVNIIYYLTLNNINSESTIYSSILILMYIYYYIFLKMGFKEYIFSYITFFLSLAIVLRYEIKSAILINIVVLLFVRLIKYIKKKKYSFYI